MSCYILADNQDVTRYALEKLIQQDEEHTIRYTADRIGLIALLQECEHAVVVVDYTLFDFLDEQQLMNTSERFSMTRWIIFSDELSESFLRRVIYTSNAFSVVFKDCSLLTICDALRLTAQGKRYVCQRAMEMVQAHPADNEDDRHVLTMTEKDIVIAIAMGKTTKEIAQERISSIHTINTHRKNIFRKLKVNTAHEVIKYALRAGWVDAADFQI